VQRCQISREGFWIGQRHVLAEELQLSGTMSGSAENIRDLHGLPTLRCSKPLGPPVESYTENPTCWPSRFLSCFSPKILSLEVYLKQLITVW
jgi:hypothetical protein